MDSIPDFIYRNVELSYAALVTIYFHSFVFADVIEAILIEIWAHFQVNKIDEDQQVTWKYPSPHPVIVAC